MKIFLHFLTVYLVSATVSEAYRLNNHEYFIPLNLNVKVSPECALALDEMAKTQLKYLDQQRAWLEQELALNQENRALFTQISHQERSVIRSDAHQERSVIRSDEKPQEEATSAQGIIPNVLNRTSNVAGDILNTAGQLAKDDIDMKAAIIGGALEGAGQTASTALKTSGQAAAQAAANVEDGLKKTFTRFGK